MSRGRVLGGPTGGGWRASILIALLAASGCGGPSEPVALVGETMGTTYSIKLASLPEGATANGLKSAVDAALARFDAQMSTWRTDSELSRFNASESTDWFSVSEATATVVAEAQRISRDSGGAFDVTVLPLVNLWSFGPEARPQEVPSAGEIAARREFVGYEMLEVRPEPPALRKADPRVTVDLSAIAPGYAADLVAERLDGRGVTGYMVEIGGEVRTKGTKADGSAWRIGIERPLPDRRVVERVVALSGESLATSGDYRHYFEEEGVRYSHTIDPRTGRPIGHALASVSVLTEDCMTADGMATTVMVLGPDEGYDWLAERDVAALLIVRRNEGFIARTTPAFDARYGR